MFEHYVITLGFHLDRAVAFSLSCKKGKVEAQINKFELRSF